MADYHDPYHELELYLEKAQEEVDWAEKELKELAVAVVPGDLLDLKNSNDPLLPPPAAFQTQNGNDKRIQAQGNIEELPIKSDGVSRVCYDGNVTNFNLSSSRTRPQAPSIPFFSNLGPEIKGSSYSPNTRRKLWQKHPSLSFPETSKDLMLVRSDKMLANNTFGTLPSRPSEKPLQNGIESRTLDHSARKYRRSISEQLTPWSRYKSEDEFHFPRPPSGDVNLLSIWADNLVLELDKELSEEILNSAECFTPSSDYSLSPTKHEEPLETAIYDSSLKESPESREVKETSKSPDSGIVQTTCSTPEATEDSIESAEFHEKKLNVLNNSANGDPIFDSITPPPPQFGDEVDSKPVSKPKDQGTQTCRSRSSSRDLKLSATVCEIQDDFEKVEYSSFWPLHRIPFKTMDLEPCPVVKTVCAVNSTPEPENIAASDENTAEVDEKMSSVIDDIFSVVDNTVSRDKDLAAVLDKPKFEMGQRENLVGMQNGYHFTLPKPSRGIPKEFDKYNTIPRDIGRIAEVTTRQRSASQSEFSPHNCVVPDDLEAVIAQIKNCTFRPPPSSDAMMSTEDKNKDAGTQTTPAPLSRSSSFTWVTECDCSEWDFTNLPSGSEESLELSSCSNCKDENGVADSSSSSLDISSESDGGPGSPASQTSSLYLSACSGSSDSFEEATLTTISESTSVESSQDSLLYRPFRSSESTLRGSTLGDISEEHVSTETRSLQSSSSLTDSNGVEQNLSFPSTLKSKNSKSGIGPAQPIELNVLIANDRNSKSSSAPVLMRQKRVSSPTKTPDSSSSDSSPSGSRNKDSPNQVSGRSHSSKELNELQAIEASSWLRAAGFPQYAQMYEDNQFPIDINTVQKDHAFLHPDSIQSLFRRLNTLNRCAKMKYMDHAHRKSIPVDESDDEEQYALSENWEFQRTSRRWSRIPSTADGLAEFASSDLQPPSTKPPVHLLPAPTRKYLSPEEAYCSSYDSVFADDQQSSPDSVRRSYATKNGRTSPMVQICDCSPGSSSGSGGTLSMASEERDHERKSLRRSGSDRVKEGAKALLKRMESLKGKKKKKPEVKVEAVQKPQSGTDGSSSSSVTSSPQFLRHQKVSKSQSRSKSNTGNSLKESRDTLSTHSDSECHLPDPWQPNDNDVKNIQIVVPDLPKNKDAQKKPHTKSTEVQETNVLKVESPGKSPEETRNSYYENVCAPLVIFNDLYNEGMSESGSPNSGTDQSFSDRDPLQNQDLGDIIILNSERRDSGVGSSLTRGVSYQQAPWHCFPLNSSSVVKPLNKSFDISELTAPQILLLRKLALLKLTTVMEKFSPSSRTGWSWGVSKFMGRIRNPDYKDKVVFGVPLLLILQRTGQPLPVSIQSAMHYLRKTSLESSGLFRKSGVRSRIQKLKSLNETNPLNISYEEHQAYDVADMLKQYFRELPEALLTNKLSETFICIFQHVPDDLRLEAIQAALMLMPDENREVLRALLEFLYEVCQHSDVNQMTATNLAVCFAPSLFHLSTPRSASSSPRHRKTVGVPDLKELNENRAAYECLSCMISNYKVLFTVTEEVISQSRISFASYFRPSTIEQLSNFVHNGQKGWKGYIESCIQMLLKEAKDKSKGWKVISQNDHVETSYKKLSDGHPLKLWKISTEVEAPPTELLNKILRERHLWDNTMGKSKVLSRLSKQTEIFQYLSSLLLHHPPSDYCILRSWRTDLPKGTCVLIECSLEYLDVESFPGSIRAITLASRYLIEPCGAGKSRITYVSRVDTRGRSPEWYNRAYGHICTLSLVKLRNSFVHTGAEGPETKV